MPTRDAFKILKYALAFFSCALGISVLAGVVLHDPVPAQIRYTFGTVLVLLGIYRFVMTKMRTSRSRDLDA